uniref:Uncharacterized protein n=1 Tax=Rhizophora mucronata TaxID=61149 RepID=A0A2P2QA35_RHIMU
MIGVELEYKRLEELHIYRMP